MCPVYIVLFELYIIIDLLDNNLELRPITNSKFMSLIKIKDALFRQSYNSRPILNYPLNFTLNSSILVTGPLKLTFLGILSGQYLTSPLARTILKDTYLLNFSDSREKVYLLARYELYSHKGTLEQDNINSVENFILDKNNYNSNKVPDLKLYSDLITSLNLSHLTSKWINSLSNGQLRRARLAKALTTFPSLLFIDDLFLGLDPSSSSLVSSTLKELDIPFVIGVRKGDFIPEWIKNVVYVDESGIKIMPTNEFDWNVQKNRTLVKIGEKQSESTDSKVFSGSRRTNSLALVDSVESKEIEHGTTKESNSVHLEFINATIQYKDLKIISNLNWKIPRNSKWRILGDNGTGKTSLLSIITSDHPQSYKSILKINNTFRKPGDGLNFFQLNNKIGISSPELHSLVPFNKTMIEVILNGLVNDIGNSNFVYKYKENDLKKSEWVNGLLNRFQSELETYKDTPFGELSVTYQKLALFLRAIIKKPEILILDEAFSCVNDEVILQKCHHLIKDLDMTVLIIGHLEWELPDYDYVLKLSGNEDRDYEFFEVEKDDE